MPTRLDVTEVSSGIYQACVIACVNLGIEPFDSEEVIAHEPSHAVAVGLFGVEVTNAVHVIPARKRIYKWETFIAEVERHAAIHNACIAGKLIDNEVWPQFVLAQWDWTEHGYEEDFEWIQGDWHELEPDANGSYSFYEEKDWEVLKVLDEDGHGHPIMAVLKRRN